MQFFFLNIGAANRHSLIFFVLHTSSFTSSVCWISNLTLEFCRIVNVFVFIQSLKETVHSAIYLSLERRLRFYCAVETDPLWTLHPWKCTNDLSAWKKTVTGQLLLVNRFTNWCKIKFVHWRKWSCQTPFMTLTTEKRCCCLSIDDDVNVLPA